MQKITNLQFKVILIIFGVILLIVLIFDKGLQYEKDAAKEQAVLENVWLVENTQEGLKVLREGVEEIYEYQQSLGKRADYTENVQDFVFAYPKEVGCVGTVQLEDKEVVAVTVKEDVQRGKLLSIKDNIAEIEGVGMLPFEEHAAIYETYDSVSYVNRSMPVIGYSQEYVVYEGQIAATLLYEKENYDKIRVLIKNTDYSDKYYETVSIGTSEAYYIRTATEQVEIAGGQITDISMDSDYFKNNNRIYIEPVVEEGFSGFTLQHIERSQGKPTYLGTMELEKCEEGLLVINEVSMEEYLSCVVSSEMPSSYPLEALKAQAVCARTYAYQMIVKSGISQFGAHVDDGAGYQVYNNFAKDAATTQAVEETTGQMIFYGEDMATTYYYSTSCGFGADAGVWGNDSEIGYIKAKRMNYDTVEGTNLEKEDNGIIIIEEMSPEDAMDENSFRGYITSEITGDIEAEENWYRWTYDVPALDSALLLQKVQAQYASSPKRVLTLDGEGNYVSQEITALGEIENISVESRLSGGVMNAVIIQGSAATVKVVTENNIRHVLSNVTESAIRRDGSTSNARDMIPSAFAVIDLYRNEEGKVTGYKITGGGFGHGVGMSQNGAKNLAENGYTYDKILAFYFQGITIREDVYAS